MSAKILNGCALAAKIRRALAPRIKAVADKLGRAPSLAVIAARDNAGRSYLQAKIKACQEAGLTVFTEALAAGASTQTVTDILSRWGKDPAVDAVVVDFPLPSRVDSQAARAAIPPAKDAEGLSPFNFGLLFMAKSHKEIESRGLIVPCTAQAAVELLLQCRTPLAGKRAVVIGRSATVGRAAAHLLSMLDLTVTLCHSRTRGLKGEVRLADVVFACAGKARLIKGSWLKSGAIVIDAGINAIQGKICGDVDFDGAKTAASFITPVPGGVGPVTIARLLANAVALAERAAAK